MQNTPVGNSFVVAKIFNDASGSDYINILQVKVSENHYAYVVESDSLKSFSQLHDALVYCANLEIVTHRNARAHEHDEGLPNNYDCYDSSKNPQNFGKMNIKELYESEDLKAIGIC